MSAREQQRPGAEATGATVLNTASLTRSSDDPGVCAWCERHERWRDPHHGEVPWSMCVYCYRDIVAGFRRRRQAELRMPPLADVLLPQQRSAACRCVS